MNGFCHIEIPSEDFTKAKKFYGELFDWTFQEMPGADYLLFKPPDGVGGGFSKGYEFVEKPGVLLLIEVADINGIIEKAVAIGGSRVKEKTQITPEYGYYAVIRDLEGNQLGLWSQK